MQTDEAVQGVGGGFVQVESAVINVTPRHEASSATVQHAGPTHVQSDGAVQYSGQRFTQTDAAQIHVPPKEPPPLNADPRANSRRREPLVLQLLAVVDRNMAKLDAGRDGAWLRRVRLAITNDE